MAIRYSYDDTTTNKRGIGDMIYNIDFQHAPLLALLGFKADNLNKFQVKSGWPNTKLEWLEDTNTAFRTLLTEDMDISETGANVTTGTGQYFRQGDVLAVYAVADTALVTVLERYLVTSVATDTLTIVRGHGATSAVGTALTGDVLILETRAVPENNTYAVEHITTPTAPYNYTQILDAAVEVSRTESHMSRYGISDLMDYQIAKLFDSDGSEGRLAKLLHGIFYYGERVIRAASPAYGFAGGFKTFVTTSTASTDHVFSKSAAALQKADIHKVMRAINDAGGKCTHIVCGSWLYEKIPTFYEDKISTVEEKKIRGTPEVMQIRTPHGLAKVLYDYLCPASEMYFLNENKAGWIPFDEFERKTVYGDNSPSDGLIEKVVGEYTFALANPKSFGVITNISITT